MTEFPLELTEDYIETYRFNKWVECFTDASNPKTFGNATQSTLAVYNTTNYSSAAKIGSDNYKKVKYLGRAMFENMKDEKGRPMSFKNVLTTVFNKMQKSDNPGWFDRFNMMVNYVDEPVKQTGIAVKTENKDGTVSEIKIISFERPKDEQEQ